MQHMGHVGDLEVPNKGDLLPKEEQEFIDGGLVSISLTLPCLLRVILMVTWVIYLSYNKSVATNK